MTRLILVTLVLVLVVRVFWRLGAGILEGMTAGQVRARVPRRGVRMVRDPVCGTFVLPDRALTAPGREPVYFCSPDCRDRYLARPA